MPIGGRMEDYKMKIKHSAGERVFDLFNYLFMIFAAVIAVYPFLYIVFASLSDPITLIKHKGILWRPAGFSLAGYKAVLQNHEIFIGYANTAFYVVVGTALSVIITAMLSYPLALQRFRYRKVFLKLIVFTLFFSAGMIPTYMIVKMLGLLDTRWSVIAPNIIITYNVMIMRTAYLAVPPSLEESARLDGANDMQTFFRIMLPSVKGTIAVLVLYQAVANWNSWFSALLYIKDRTKYPLQLFLREILIQSSSQEMGNYSINADSAFLDEIVKHATTVVATVPMLVIYPFAQKYFIKGAMVGAVKE